MFLCEGRHFMHRVTALLCMCEGDDGYSWSEEVRSRYICTDMSVANACAHWQKGYFIIYFLSGRRGSNPRPSAWEADALPTELLPREYAYRGLIMCPVMCLWCLCYCAALVSSVTIGSSSMRTNLMVMLSPVDQE